MHRAGVTPHQVVALGPSHREHEVGGADDLSRQLLAARARWIAPESGGDSRGNLIHRRSDDGMEPGAADLDPGEPGFAEARPEELFGERRTADVAGADG